MNLTFKSVGSTTEYVNVVSNTKCIIVTLHHNALVVFLQVCFLDVCYSILTFFSHNKMNYARVGTYFLIVYIQVSHVCSYLLFFCRQWSTCWSESKVNFTSSL